MNAINGQFYKGITGKYRLMEGEGQGDLDCGEEIDGEWLW